MINEETKPEFGNPEAIKAITWGKTERENELYAYLDENDFEYEAQQLPNGKIQIIITL